jgi:hypothetical protein
MAVDTERRAKKTASRLERSLLLQPITTAMPYTPPNHIPDVSAHVTDGNFIQSPDDHLPSMSTLTDDEPGSQLHHSSTKKRRSSKSKVPSELRRSTSTPHMRNMALGNSGELSPTSNKPRNKLGYHRTSVACGRLHKLHFVSRAGFADRVLQDIADGGRSDAFLLQKTTKAVAQTASG